MSNDLKPQDIGMGEIDFLTPDQRKEAIAQILATVGLRILKAEDEQAEIQ